MLRPQKLDFLIMKKNVFIVIGLITALMIGGIFVFYKIVTPRGLVAFVIDDWGYNRRNIDLVFQIERPLTLSILPNLYYTDYIAEAVRKKGDMYDMILHLPLESKGRAAAETTTICCDMSEVQIISILQDNIKDIPGIVGVSSHQGSKATENEKVIRVILNELKKRDLFFLDSLTTPNSVCPAIAKEIGIKCAQRDVFLDLTDQTDSENFEAYIRGQIRELASIAIAEGRAIGVGHNKRATLEVIRDIIPELEKEGIKIVPLKELVR